MSEQTALSFQGYLDAVVASRTEHPEWRLGQAFFNVLYELRPDLAERARATEFDPFYNDRILDFLVWVGRELA